MSLTSRAKSPMSRPGSRGSTPFTSRSLSSRSSMGFSGRHDASEMSKDQVLNTKQTFHNVRKGGPKEKRIKRVELMGEHTAKPLHWIKVTQDVSKFQRLLDPELLRAEFESLVGDVGDAYRPFDESTQLPYAYCFVGFFRAADARAAALMYPQFTINGVDSTIEEAKAWFIELYPKPVMFNNACNTDEDDFEVEIGATY